MRALHVLAVVGALILGAVGWMQYDLGKVMWWQASLFLLSGLLLPYAVAIVWVLLVAPPSLRELLSGARHAFARGTLRKGASKSGQSKA